MRWLRVLALRLKSVLLRDRLDADAREELQQHLDRQIEANLASGMTPEAARRAAALDVGSLPPLIEATRDARGLLWWDALRADVRYALRQIRRRPGFSAAVILTLTIATGATSAVFAVVDAVLLRPLPYPESDRLYALYEVNSRSNIGRTRATALNFIDWQAQAGTFESMAAHIGRGYTLMGRGDPEFVVGQQCTTNFLDVLKVRPMLGRTFRPDESEAGRHRVTVITHALWMSYFGGDRSVLDTTVQLGGEPYQLIGILPPSFTYLSDQYKLFVPLVTKGSVSGSMPINRGARYLVVVARLRAGATEAEARTELDVVGKRLAREYPDTNETVTIGMSTLASERIGDAGANLLVVLSAVGFVLLIACVNVAGLAIARGQARSRELVVRAAIGASRPRLIRQLATEAFVLFLIGGAAGIAVAAWTVGTLASTLPASIPRVDEIAIDARFLGLTGVVIVLVGVLSSVLPALQVTRRATALHAGATRGVVSPTRSAQRTRSALIVVQVAVAVMLLSGATLALRSLQRVWETDRGFDITQTMTFAVSLSAAQYPGGADMRTFITRANDAMQALPDVSAVGMTSHLPLNDNNLENSFTVDGAPLVPGQDPPVAGLRFISGRYVEAIGARLLEGRAIDGTDTPASQPVAIVTADFARRYIPPGRAIGARLKLGGPDSDDAWRAVIGVIADVRHAAIDREARPEVWLPFAQVDDGLLTSFLRGVNVAVRTHGDPGAAIPGLRAAIHSINPRLPLISLRSMEELASRSTAQRRLETSMLAAFAAIAVVLAGVGLFGVMAFHVSRQTQEFGVRLALGAAPRHLFANVMRRAGLLLLIGLAIGIPAALLMGRAMAALLYRVGPADPLALAASALAMTIVTALACALPARRAMRTDPLIAIRAE